MSAYLKKFIVYGLSLIVLSVFASPAAAQTTAIPPSLPSTLPLTLSPLPSSIPPTSPLYTDLLVHNMFHTFSCLAVGQSVIGQPCLTYQLTKNTQGVIQSIPVLAQVDLNGGALGATTSVIGLLLANPPVKTADYLASVGTSLGIVKEAHAQGVVGSGANVISPIISLWQVSRNIAYIILVVIFVVIGFMVMFRQKINPQTVITAQAALPGLVIGLILITFSYFLAGLISDTAFIGTNMVGYYFAAAQGKTNDPGRLNFVEKTKDENVVSIFSRFLGLANQSDVSSALATVWEQIDDVGAQNWLRVIAGFIAYQQSNQVTSLAKLVPVVGEGIQAALSLATGVVAGANPTGTLGWGLSFVAFLILLYSMFRLLLRLINSFLTIIFLTISAPFQFLWASLPGRQGLSTDWMLNMLGNVLVFPAVLTIFYFVAFIQNQNIGPLQGNASVAILQRTTFPLLGGIDLGFIRILLAFGALVALPTIPDIVVKTVGKASQAGELIGREIGSGVRQGQQYGEQYRQGIATIGERGGGLHDKIGYRPGVEFDDQGRRRITWEPSELTSSVGGIRKSRLAVGRVFNRFRRR